MVFEVGDRVRIKHSECKTLVELTGEIIARNAEGVYAVYFDNCYEMPKEAYSHIEGKTVEVFDGPNTGSRWMNGGCLELIEQDDSNAVADLLKVIGVEHG